MTTALEAKLAKIVAWCDNTIDIDTRVGNYADIEELCGLVDDPEVREWFEARPESLYTEGGVQ